MAGYAIILKMISPDKFLTASLAAIPEGIKAARILAAAIDAVDPGNAVRRFVRREGSVLWVDNKAYSLGLCKRVFLVGAGKASLAMALAIGDLLRDVLTAGVIITKVKEKREWGAFPIPQFDRPELKKYTRSIPRAFAP